MNRLLLVVLVGCGSSTPAPSPPVEPAPPPVAAATPPEAAVAPAPPTAAAPVGHPRTDLISRALLFGNPERTGAQISPDGKQLAWQAVKDGVLNVWVAPIGALDQAKAVTHDTARPVRIYAWAYTSKHLLYMQDVGGDENFHLFRVDLADGKATDITPYKGARAALMGLDPRWPTTALVSINDRDAKVFDIYKIDLLTAKRTSVAQNTESFAGFDVDHDWRVRFASKKLPDGATELLTPETKGGTTTWKSFETIAFEDAETTGIASFSPNGKAVYMRDSRGRDTSALVSLDLATRKQTVIAEDPRADAGAMIVHPTKHTLQAVAFQYLKTQWKVIDPSIAKDLDGLAKLGDGDVNIVSRTLDDKTWIVQFAADQHPGTFYLWDRRSQKSTLLFAARPELEKQPLVKMTPVEIKARDGLTLVSYLSLPTAVDPEGDGKPTGPVPMVLYVHGGPWARDRWVYQPAHQLLANRGYAVLSVNYRGSTGFGKKFLNAANLQWGKAMHDDLLDAVAWAVQQGVTAKDTVCIMGGSYGGYATLVGVAMTPDVFRCGVDLVGPSNLRTLLATIPPYWKPGLGLWHARMGNPETPDGKALLEAASPLTHVAAIKRPLLIAQGANDPRVKQSESEQIVAAMMSRNLPVTYMVFPDEGHGFARPENNIVFYAAAEAFLSAHLGGSYLPVSKAEVEASSVQIKNGKDGIPGW